MTAPVVKQSPCAGERRDRGVAIGIAGSGRVGAIALPECDRRAVGAVGRRRTAEFGAKGEAGLRERSTVSVLLKGGWLALTATWERMSATG